MRITANDDELDSFRIPTDLGAVASSVAARLWPQNLDARILEVLLKGSGLREMY